MQLEIRMTAVDVDSFETEWTWKHNKNNISKKITSQKMSSSIISLASLLLWHFFYYFLFCASFVRLFFSLTLTLPEAAHGEDVRRSVIEVQTIDCKCAIARIVVSNYIFVVFAAISASVKSKTVPDICRSLFCVLPHFDSHFRCFFFFFFFFYLFCFRLSLNDFLLFARLSSPVVDCVSHCSCAFSERRVRECISHD